MATKSLPAYATPGGCHVARDEPERVQALRGMLRAVERELRFDSAAEVAGALTHLGFADEPQLAAAIRSGVLDDRPDDVMACLFTLVRQRLTVAHPGYDQR